MHSRAYMFFRAILAGVRWVLALALLALAWNLKDPHLLPYREYETPVLLLVASLGIALGFLLRQGIGRRLWLSVMTLTLLLTLFGEAAFRYRKEAVLNGTLTAAPLLGRHFVVGYDSEDIDSLRRLVGRGLVGGIFVTRHNTMGKSVDDLREEIRELQALRQSTGLPPLVVATDQEGGIVSRLSPPLAKMPPLAALVADSRTNEELELRAEAYGERQGRELAALGVSVNFSPVVDLKPGQPDGLLDFHTLIGRRAISSDAALTARVAGAYGRGLARQGVRATLKHFPGLGGVANDTHHFSAVLEAPVADLAARDWLPFKEVAGHSAALIMLGHVILAEVDRESPVSFSRAVIQNILRGEWKHEGVLITDDLTMGAAYDRGLCGATVKALNAGVDLLLLSFDFEKYYEAMYCAARAYDRGQLDLPMLERSRRRVALLALPPVRSFP